MQNNEVDFSFSDRICGYVTEFDKVKNYFKLKTRNEKIYHIQLKDTCHASLLYNLGKPYQDCTLRIHDLMQPGIFLFVYALFYPETGGYLIEALEILFVGIGIHDFVFNKPDWWIQQVIALADFYLKAEFGKDMIDLDFRNYRTIITHSGYKEFESSLQETATLSRLIGGFGSAFLLTGQDLYLDAAEKGIEYLRKHMRFYDADEKIIYWYHGIKVQGANEHKLFASEFFDDFDSITAYEQIYALAGPSITFRINGDPKILEDIQLTLDLFDRCFFDEKNGGYFAFLDPLTLDPKSDSLKTKKARKNWNSLGDHLPVYLIHTWLATQDEKYLKRMEYLLDLIAKYCPDYSNSPFVLERFMEDWSPDFTHDWQKNRGIVGHNLKIAWTMMRVHNVIPKKEYLDFALKIAEIMPQVGLDSQRGGWYDVMERYLKPGEKQHRFSFHDRKAWWQQEEGILAYMILAGVLKNEHYQQLAIESTAFYNAFFLDHDDNGIFFTTLANGLPFLSGNERFKGSHSMSACHSFELALLAQIYSNLLINKNPLELYFKPYPSVLKDNILHVAPEMLPQGSVQISEVWIDDQPYHDFDARALSVRMPDRNERVKVKVRYIPVG